MTEPAFATTVSATAPLSRDEQITIMMSTIPSRTDGMLMVLHDLLPACDHFVLNLDGHAGDLWFPEFADPKLHILRSIKPMGPRAKFALADVIGGYHIIVDDDIMYPSDYVPTMIRHIEHFQRLAVVGNHGRIFTSRPPPHPKSKITYLFASEIRDYTPVHSLGTGTIAYHSSLLQLGMNQMVPGKMDDQVAIYCQQHAIPMMLCPHRAEWMKDVPLISKRNAIRHNVAYQKEASDRVSQYENWKLYVPATYATDELR